ncbi:hypothetical protein GCM10007216_05200 [Thalassobacillus devorans]|uniref:Uncharacterized protein n=3 Tax=Thalassobacillus devorans TaxID=279813 RepID=A0ABQ1NHR5_9BACI|nr:hypothetical protein GCM10007216_05200 [Thalassobacillus devorans]
MVYSGFILLLNGLEIVALLLNKVVYDNGWNIFFTFLAYVIGLFVLDFYYYCLKKSIRPLAN